MFVDVAVNFTNRKSWVVLWNAFPLGQKWSCPSTGETQLNCWIQCRGFQYERELDIQE